MTGPMKLRGTYSVAANLPPGYHELPLDGIDRLIGSPVVDALSAASGVALETVPRVLGTLDFFLKTLAIKNVVYCGIGQHASLNGEPVTSWLTVSILEYGESRNPRLVVHELSADKLSSNFSGDLAPVDITGRPILLSESVQLYPAPELTEAEYSSDGVEVFQMEAIIPSDDGTNIAVIELSTISVENGPQFRQMLLSMATTLDFVNKASTKTSLHL